MLDLGFTADGVAGYLACIAFVIDGCPPPLQLQVKERIVLEVDNSLLKFNLVQMCWMVTLFTLHLGEVRLHS